MATIDREKVDNEADNKSPFFIFTDRFNPGLAKLNSGAIRNLVEVNRWIKYFADYYPFGHTLRSAGTGFRYGFQGEFAKDETEETGWHAFELRMYSSVIGRWISPDPERQFSSPYVGMGNNPIAGIDQDGAFSNKFGAWLYKITHGNNGQIEHSSVRGEYYVGQQTEYTGPGIG